VIGVIVFKLFGFSPWLASSLAVATAIAAMHATKTLHPPGGATALIAVTGSDKIHDLGFLYAVFPVATGVVIMLAVALVINNLAPSRKYPEFWW
jgi:CBS-domain-containing membrane protein